MVITRNMQLVTQKTFFNWEKRLLLTKVNNAISVPIKRIIIGMAIWIVDKPCLAGTHLCMVKSSAIGSITETDNAGHNTHRYLFPKVPSMSHRESETVSKATDGERGRT